jgi:ribA/ribD-fused uncharacterized protein
MKKEINAFEGEYKFLSNFYLDQIEYDGLVYPALENAFQAQKTTDLVEREKFTHYTPAKAKQKGRQLDLRDDWEFLKDDLMQEQLKIKFKNEPLRTKLMKTVPAHLVEGNWWGDEYWGRCNGKGKNKLGVLLMDVRTTLIEEDEGDR